MITLGHLWNQSTTPFLAKIPTRCYFCLLKTHQTLDLSSASPSRITASILSRLLLQSTEVPQTLALMSENLSTTILN